jgi:hypothetical protein
MDDKIVFQDAYEKEAWIAFAAGALAGAWSHGFGDKYDFNPDAEARHAADEMLCAMRERDTLLRPPLEPLEPIASVVTLDTLKWFVEASEGDLEDALSKMPEIERLKMVAMREFVLGVRLA